MEKAIGIDLGGTSVKIGFIQANGKILNQWSIKTDSSDQGSKIIKGIVDSIHSKLAQENLAIEDFKGIGMGSPGNVDRKNGTVIGAYNLGWSKLQPVAQQFEQAFKLPVKLDNDANVAALGEQWQGAGDNEDNIVFITLGTGVGGGILADGKLVHGNQDSAGEIGHMTVASGKFNFKCTCGKEGCLETLASATGIVRVGKIMADEYRDKSRLKDFLSQEGDIEAKHIYDFAKEGDPLALAIVDQVGDYLAFACGNLANVLNPSTFVIGGGVSKAGQIIIDSITGKLDRYIFPPMLNSTKVRIAKLGNEAGILGASSLILREG